MNDQQAWLDWRRGGIGASDVPAIAGLSPFASPWSIWADKLGLLIQRETDEMRFGRDLEPLIAKWFSDETELWVVGAQMQCQHATEPWARCTVDGFVVDSPDHALGLDSAGMAVVGQPADVLGVYEAKFTSSAIGDDAPLHYVAQAQWQMYVTEQPQAWLAIMSLAFGRPRLHVIEIARDDAAIAQLVEICRAFWFDHVLTATPPPVDASKATAQAISEAYAEPAPDTIADLSTLSEQAARLGELREQAKSIGIEMQHLMSQLRAALGTRTEGHVDGQLAVSWRPQTRRVIDTKRFRADWPELATEYTVESSTRIFRLHQGKGADDDERAVSEAV